MMGWSAAMSSASGFDAPQAKEHLSVLMQEQGLIKE